MIYTKIEKTGNTRFLKLERNLRILIFLAFLFEHATVIFPQRKGSDHSPVALPVILIHGIGGSDLRQRSRGLLSDGGFPNDVLKFRAGDPQKLEFDSSGSPRQDTISRNVVAVGFYNVPLSKDITDLSRHLQKRGFGLDKMVFEFAYDFRYSVLNNAVKLGQLIDDIKNRTKTKQVDIVGHSMGGLIAKVYVSDPENALNVRNLIFVGTPHLGAPKALKALRYGDDLSTSIIDGCKLKRAVHNMPGMMNLLPGKRYFEVHGGYFFDDDDIDGDSVRGLLDYESMISNLKNGKETTSCKQKPDVDITQGDKDLPSDRLLSSLVDVHGVLFHQSLDYWKKPDGVTVINLVGFGVPTIETIRERSGIVTYGYTNEGDGTVPLWSAEAVKSDFIYYINVGKLRTEHSTMIGSRPLRRQILNLLTKGPGIYIGETSTARKTS